MAIVFSLQFDLPQSRGLGCAEIGSGQGDDDSTHLGALTEAVNIQFRF